MRSVKPYLLFLSIGGIVALGLLASALWGKQLSEDLVAWLGIALIVAAALGSYAIRRARERRTGAGAESGIEVHRARRAQAGAFFDAVLAGIAIAAVLLLTNAMVSAPTVLIVLSAALVCDFWIRYLVLRQRDGSSVS